ncbi:MAG: response regulator, partial [Deltaproteobacteria bacterium]|nr:response regulator [Deltaproteobacteria bacterium]
MAKILIVDDNKLILVMISDLLQGAGHTMIVHDSPLGAESIVARENPELVLLDVEMPEMNGDKLVSKIKEKHKDIKIHFLSDKPTAELEKLTMESGADGYISKACMGEELIKRVADILGSKEEIVEGARVESSALVAIEDASEAKDISEILSFLHLRVDLAPNEAMAKELAAKNNYDLFISEADSAGLDGLDLYKDIIEGSSRLKGRAIFLMSPGMTSMIFTAKELNCQYLIKPVDAKQVMEKIVEIRKHDDDSDRRRDARYKWRGECEISEAQDIKARVENISLTGAKVTHDGGPLESGSKVSVFIKELDIEREGEIQWSELKGGIVESGVRFSREILSTFVNYIVPNKDTKSKG